MSNKILFVFEGERTESQISKSLQKHIFNSETEIIVECLFKAEIYLFFDYDGHATNADDGKIIKLLIIY